jgi:hypothetical protein
MVYELEIAPNFDHAPPADPDINFHESSEQEGPTKSFIPGIGPEITPEVSLVNSAILD